VDNLKKATIISSFADAGHINCQICGRSLLMGLYGGERDRWPHLDHDHDCCKAGCEKCVRGILCRECNGGLGFFRNDPGFLRLAAKYLETSFLKCETS
jgi:hypothetical protein